MTHKELAYYRQRKAEILALRNAGWTLSAIARKYNFSRQRAFQLVGRCPEHIHPKRSSIKLIADPTLASKEKTE